MKKRLRRLISLLGPGFITGASDDDPSGIATYSQTGALFGYQQLWTPLFTFPFMTTVQEMCGRIGIVTGKGITGVLKKYYPKNILGVVVILLCTANIINIGANLGAMASVTKLVFPSFPFAFLLIFIAVLTLLLEIFLSYRVYSHYLKYLTFALFAYIAAVFTIHQDWSLVLNSSLIPFFTFDHAYLLNIVAVLGTTISPYLFFWQADEEVEEEVLHHKLKSFGIGIPRISKKDLRNMHIDTTIGMLFSNVVMFAIILTTASTLHAQGITIIQTADQAAQALRPLAGDFTFILFAIGIIGTGFLSVPILAGSASYAASEAMGWKTGLYRKVNQAHKFYMIIVFSTIIGLLVNFIDIKPFVMLYYTAVINGLAAPFLLVCILAISNNKKIMGNHTNSITSNILGITITIIMTTAAIFLVVSQIF